MRRVRFLLFCIFLRSVFVLSTRVMLKCVRNEFTGKRAKRRLTETHHEMSFMAWIESGWGEIGRTGGAHETPFHNYVIDCITTGSAKRF